MTPVDVLARGLMTIIAALSLITYRPTPTIPAVEPKAEPVVQPTPKAPKASKVSAGRRLVTGWATYYDPGRGYAAAGPSLRAALGTHWRGTRVSVCRGAHCVSVRLTDWCACGPRHGEPTVIDLLRGDFAALSSLGSGVMTVTVTR